MIVIDVRIDVSQSVSTSERLTIAATVALPDETGPGAALSAVVAYPGGGYNRRYYDLRPAGLSGYSEAEHHVASGHVFVSIDHLGVGDSDIPTIALGIEEVARAGIDAASHIIEALRAGTLDSAISALDIPVVVGLGQSYGGFLLILGQSERPVFDGIGVLGYSALHVTTPWPDGMTLDDVLALRGGNGLDHPMRPWFHAPDVPAELVIADMTKEEGSLLADTPWSTRYLPGGPVVTVARGPREAGVVREQAARIESPVLLVFGDTDVSPDPWSEPSAYRGSPLVTLATFSSMAHMHNFASTRDTLWETIDGWVETVARRAHAD